MPRLSQDIGEYLSDKFLKYNTLGFCDKKNESAFSLKIIFINQKCNSQATVGCHPVYQHTSLYAGKLRVCTLTVHLAQLAYKHRGASVPRPSLDANFISAKDKDMQKVLCDKFWA